MKLKNYSTLKAASKLSFSKEEDKYFLTEKKYDASSGEEISGKTSILDIDT